jgi:hypothetical protein
VLDEEKEASTGTELETKVGLTIWTAGVGLVILNFDIKEKIKDWKISCGSFCLSRERLCNKKLLCLFQLILI